MQDVLGDRMKALEQQEAGRRLPAHLPVLARIDGRGFSRFTRHMSRPFNPWLSEAMCVTTRLLVEASGAVLGYTQSDEISLVWAPTPEGSERPYGDKIQKLTSILASMATACFNAEFTSDCGEHPGYAATFDCRVWAVPDETEAANTLLWRALDAQKNSISGLARCYFSHRGLQGKTGEQQRAMLLEQGVRWEDYPERFRLGSWWQRRTLRTAYTPEELERLPPKHHARTNPELVVERSEVREIPMPPFQRVRNRVGVTFRGETPLTEIDGD